MCAVEISWAEAALSTFEEAANRIWQAGPDEAWPSVDDVYEVGGDVGVRLPKGAPLMDRLRIGVALASAADPLRDDLSPASVRTAGRRAVCTMVKALPRRCVTARREHRRRAVVPLGSPTGQQASPVSTEPSARALGRARPRNLHARGPSSGVGSCGPLLGGHRRSSACSAGACTARQAPRSTSCSPMLPEPMTQQARSATLSAPWVSLPDSGTSRSSDADARCGALMEALTGAWPTDERLATVLETYNFAADRTEGIATVDFALGALTFLADMTPEAGEAVFAIARTVGWIAHAQEEYSEEPLRYRFRARYIGH